MSEDLTLADSHFAFGENWASYAENITEAEILEAEKGLKNLLGDNIDGLSFLDIGCGSGLHSLAALRMGAKDVLAIDIDEKSVATTETVLKRFFPNGQWRVENKSVFDICPDGGGLQINGGEAFDIVYSWGVLHHTGDMMRAIRIASSLVVDRGYFVFALYRRVWLDQFWKIEKRWYSRSDHLMQNRAMSIYRSIFRLGLRFTGRSFDDFIATYSSKRGMNFEHDIHDWLGGWPYESISPREVESFMKEQGFLPEQVFARNGLIAGREIGLLGSGCDEYVYRRV